MTRSLWSRTVRRLVSGPNPRPAKRHRLGCEPLEDRSVPATLNNFLTAEHLDLAIGYTGGASGTWSLGVFDNDNSVSYTADEALLYVGRSTTQIRAGYVEAYTELLDDEEKDLVTAIQMQQWQGTPDAGRWVHKNDLRIPVSAKVAKAA